MSGVLAGGTERWLTFWSPER